MADDRDVCDDDMMAVPPPSRHASMPSQRAASFFSRHAYCALSSVAFVVLASVVIPTATSLPSARALTTTNPRLSPLVESSVAIASYSSSTGSQTGGYLYRDTSNR